MDVKAEIVEALRETKAVKHQGSVKGYNGSMCACGVIYTELLGRDLYKASTDQEVYDAINSYLEPIGKSSTHLFGINDAHDDTNVICMYPTFKDLADYIEREW